MHYRSNSEFYRAPKMTSVKPFKQENQWSNLHKNSEKKL